MQRHIKNAMALEMKEFACVGDFNTCMSGHLHDVWQHLSAMIVLCAMCSGVSKKRRVIVVLFIGGVTFAEVAALRFLGSRPEVNCTFVIATTKLINGTSLLESIVDDSITAANNVAVL